MKKTSNVLLALTLIALSSLVEPGQAHAYLDPGTGSYILQMLLAALAGIIYGVKVFWSSIKVFLKNLFNSKSGNDKTEG